MRTSALLVVFACLFCLIFLLGCTTTSVCGNGLCETGEDSVSCSSDCGFSQMQTQEKNINNVIGAPITKPNATGAATGSGSGSGSGVTDCTNQADYTPCGNGRSIEECTIDYCMNRVCKSDSVAVNGYNCNADGSKVCFNGACVPNSNDKPCKSDSDCKTNNVCSRDYCDVYGTKKCTSVPLVGESCGTNDPISTGDCLAKYCAVISGTNSGYCREDVEKFKGQPCFAPNLGYKCKTMNGTIYCAN